MRRFYAQPGNFTGDVVALDPDETRHLRDVLRLRAADEVSVFDGQGREFVCRITEIGRKTSELTVMNAVDPASPESPLEITVAATVLNGEKYDLIIQKAVELGVAALIPLHTTRCDVKPKDANRRMTRWRRIALEATKQSGRAKLMRIGDPVAFDELIIVLDASTSVLFSERDGGSFDDIRTGGEITALFGPKGGWDDGELELAGARGVNVVTLGGRILRAETASIVITAILQHRFGDLK